MKITTTLNRLRKAEACNLGYEVLVKALGGAAADRAPIDALFILESNGVADVEWLLQSSACIEDPAPALKLYRETMATARKLYLETTATARRLYKETNATAWKLYQESTATAWKLYYLETTAPARKLYKETQAAALREIFKTESRDA